MRKTGSIICPALVTVLLSVVSPVVDAEQPGQPLSFAEALQRLEKHPSLEASRAQIAGAEAENRAARALGLPRLGVEATYGHFSDPIEVDLAPINHLVQSIDPALPSIPNPILQPESFGFAMATVIWPVFTGGRIDAARNATAAGIEVAGAQGEVTEDALLLDLVARYYGVSINTRALAVQEAVVSSLQKHLSNARALERDGQIAAAERMRAEVALAQAEVDEQERLHALQTARAGLDNLLDLHGPGPRITAAPPAQMPPLANLEQLQGDARATNPLLRQLKATAEQAEQAIRGARAAYWPDITIIGGYELESYHLPELIPDWTLTANLTLDIFDGGARRAGVSLAREKWRQAKAIEREAEDRIQLQVQTRYLAYRDARSRLEVTRRTEALARESLRMQRAAFAAGMGRSIDVVDAENALSTALLQGLAARYDSLLAWTALMLSSGRRLQVQDVLSQNGGKGHGK